MQTAVSAALISRNIPVYRDLRAKMGFTKIALKGFEIDLAMKYRIAN
jgi:hypothetical protein